MGMIACYQMIEGKAIKELLNKTDEEVFEAIEELQEMDECVLDIDKLWDGLHFMLTGVSAAEPLRDNPLSEAVVGVDSFFDDENSDYITYILPERMAAIMNALKCFEIENAVRNFEPEEFARKEIYPDIWVKEDKEELQEELSESFYALKNFYEKAAQSGKGVIVSIY